MVAAARTAMDPVTRRRHRTASAYKLHGSQQGYRAATISYYLSSAQAQLKMAMLHYFVDPLQFLGAYLANPGYRTHHSHVRMEFPAF